MPNHESITFTRRGSEETCEHEAVPTDRTPFFNMGSACGAGSELSADAKKLLIQTGGTNFDLSTEQVFLGVVKQRLNSVGLPRISHINIRGAAELGQRALEITGYTADLLPVLHLYARGPRYYDEKQKNAEIKQSEIDYVTVKITPDEHKDPIRHAKIYDFSKSFLNVVKAGYRSDDMETLVLNPETSGRLLNQLTEIFAPGEDPNAYSLKVTYPNGSLDKPGRWINVSLEDASLGLVLKKLRNLKLPLYADIDIRGNTDAPSADEFYLSWHCNSCKPISGK